MSRFGMSQSRFALPGIRSDLLCQTAASGSRLEIMCIMTVQSFRSPYCLCRRVYTFRLFGTSSRKQPEQLWR